MLYLYLCFIHPDLSKREITRRATYKYFLRKKVLPEYLFPRKNISFPSKYVLPAGINYSSNGLLID